LRRALVLILNRVGPSARVLPRSKLLIIYCDNARNREKNLTAIPQMAEF
jgi:hypothetical protein